jgi:putative membrane protein
MLYDWIKALHVISMIAWMAGLLYLPRLFVYHVQAQAGSIQSDTFKIMERRLLKAIMNPAMIATFVFGIWLIALNPSLLSQGWLHAKILLVLGMAGAHGAMGRWRKDFEADRNVRPQRFYRIANEVPTVLMIAVVILVIVRPF